jgi:antitoxin VapB
MGIFIKNPQVERKARELAAREGKTLTAVIEEALDQQLTRCSKPHIRPSFAEMQAATDEFRRKIGLDKVKVEPMTKKDWDDLWPTGIPEIDNA